MIVRCFTFYRRDYFFGWIVRYIRDDYAEIAPMAGHFARVAAKTNCGVAWHGTAATRAR